MYIGLTESYSFWKCKEMQEYSTCGFLALRKKAAQVMLSLEVSEWVSLMTHLCEFILCIIHLHIYRWMKCHASGVTQGLHTTHDYLNVQIAWQSRTRAKQMQYNAIQYILTKQKKGIQNRINEKA